MQRQIWNTTCHSLSFYEFIRLYVLASGAQHLADGGARLVEGLERMANLMGVPAARGVLSKTHDVPSPSMRSSLFVSRIHSTPPIVSTADALR